MAIKLNFTKSDADDLTGRSKMWGCPDREDGFKLLGTPFFEEICELYPGMTSLLQLDCSDGWNLQFYDCGKVCFLISAADLAKKRFDKTICYLHSF